MKKILTALVILALTGGGALAADKLLKGDQFVIAGVHFPQPFKTTSGQVLKAGVYDLKVLSDGTESILIGLLKEGKQVGQLRGTVMHGGASYCGGCGDSQQGSGSPAKALPVDQGVRQQPAGIMGPVDAPKTFHDLGFTPGSRTSLSPSGDSLKIQGGVVKGKRLEISAAVQYGFVRPPPPPPPSG